MVLWWVAKIMKREKQKNYNRNTAREREGVALMGGGRWVLVAGERGNSPLLFVATDPAKEREILFYGRRRRQIRPPNLPEWGRRTTEDAYRQERSRRRHWPERGRESERKHRTTEAPDDGLGSVGITGRRTGQRWNHRTTDDGRRSTEKNQICTGREIWEREREVFVGNLKFERFQCVDHF
jgi:hypothetical protein